jgi:hypothetical protein
MPTLSYGRAMAWLAEREPERDAIVHADPTAARPRISRHALDRRANRLARAYA